MKKWIIDIIQRFGGRLAGSKEEAMAQDYMEEQLRAFTPHIERHLFEDCLWGKFAKLKLFCLAYYAALVLYWTSPLAALVLSSFNLFFFLTDFLFARTYLDFLYSKQKSSNVIAHLEPQGKAERTILLSGHIDSVREFIWWYYLGFLGMLFTILSGILFLLLPLFLSAAMVFLWATGALPFWMEIIYYIFVGLSPITLSYFKMHGSYVVPGAQDNLSGIAVAYHVFAHFAHPEEKGKSILQKTRLKFISFGSEETGICGSKNYVRDHLSQLQEENSMVINLDGIRLKEEIQLVTGEKTAFLSYDGNLVKKISEIFQQEKIPHRTTLLPVGGTDAAPFARAGIPATTVLGIMTHTLDPTYHTRRDVPENVEDEALEMVKKGLVACVKNWDGE